MKNIVFNKLNFFDKIVLVLGWLSVTNLVFWLAILTSFVFVKKRPFWKTTGFKVVYVFGWINLVAILGVILIGIFS